jgi:glutathione peroxidase
MGIFSTLFRRISKPVNGSIYDFTVTDMDGAEISFENYKGRKILIVNTASKCGYTPQFADLEKLHRAHSQHVSVLGFPTNNFLWQDPGSNEEIFSFCKKNFDVTFKMFKKISVKGASKHPLYKWLQAKTGKAPTWNFCKYLVGEDGNRVKFYSSRVNPMDPELVAEIVNKN